MQYKAIKLILIKAVIVFFAVIGVIFLFLIIKGYRPVIDHLTNQYWVAIGAFGQCVEAIFTLFIPIACVFISKRLEEKVEKVGNQAEQTIKRCLPQNIYRIAPEYSSKPPKGQVSFDYSNNDGVYCIGENELMFEIKFTKASDKHIYVYKDPISILWIALVKDVSEICKISDASKYDSSSRTRCPAINQIVLFQNKNDFYAAIKILEIKDDSRGAENDEVTFEYVIQTNGSPSFVN